MKKRTPQIIPGKRIDQWLAHSYPEDSRSTWQKRLKTGEVRVNGRKVSSHYKLEKNDDVTVNLRPVRPTLTPKALDLDILFEDEHYAICDKPAGLVVHPGSGRHEHTLVHGLLHHFGNSLSTIGNPERPGIVHRLDKDTSGLMVIAKTNHAHQSLAKQFENKTVQKEYHALVLGLLAPKTGTIHAPLSRNETQRQKIMVTSRPGSRDAVTHYEVIARFTQPIEASLLKIRLETGRTHQIRVHFGAIGFPILGDPLYGNRTANRTLGVMGLQRQFLHAQKLSFLSPTTGEKVTYTSKLPEELKQILDRFTP